MGGCEKDDMRGGETERKNERKRRAGGKRGRERREREIQKKVCGVW